MDELAARLLELAQTQFPVEERPFLRLAAALGVSEDEVLAAFAELQREGVIRELSAFLDPRALGYVSTLACMSVPAERVEEVGELISSLPEVTHNYLREHSTNLWFTVIAPSQEAVAEVLGEIERRSGVRPIHSLPAQELFKLRVVFSADEMSG